MDTGKVKAGEVFNNWTVLNQDRCNREVQHFMCKCVCGNKRVVRKDNLGLVQGCGCDRKTYKARTGETKPRIQWFMSHQHTTLAHCARVVYY